MRVKLVARPSGLVDLADGEGLREWPAVGDEVVLPDDEGARMCAAGLATPVAEQAKPETRRRSKD